MDPVDTSHLDMVAISSPDDASINWTVAFASYGGHGAENSVVVPFSIAPGGHLGWHTDSLEETQYIIAGSGQLQRDDGNFPVGPGWRGHRHRTDSTRSLALPSSILAAPWGMRSGARYPLEHAPPAYSPFRSCARMPVPTQQRLVDQPARVVGQANAG